MKILREWNIDAPWGKIALISWGNPNGEPVLLVHGRLDSAATFIPLLEHLPDKYYYIGFDMPGHGKSDPFPIGVTITRNLFLESIDFVVKTLDLRNFIYIGHSMGSTNGLFFNVINPGRIKKMVLIDPIPSLRRLQVRDPVEYFNMFYQSYYDNYKKNNHDDRVFTKERAINAVMKARQLNEKQASIILSRNLIPIGNDKYRLSWDRRLRLPAPQNRTVEYYQQLFTLFPIPMLVVNATDNAQGYMQGDEDAQRVITGIAEKIRHVYIKEVKGPHDIHLTSPREVSEKILKFLDDGAKSKL